MLRRALVACLLVLSACEGSGTSALRVNVRTLGLGFLRVSTGPVEEARPNEGRPWVFHELRLQNRSARTVHLDDHRTGSLLGNRELLVGDDGCGWGSPGPADPVTVACQSDYRPITLEPGQEVRSTITLWRGLPGMHAPHGRRFELRKPIEYRFTARFDSPLDRDARQGTIVLTYSLLHG